MGEENLHDRIKALQLWRPDIELQDVEVGDKSAASMNAEAANTTSGEMSVTFGMVKAKLEEWTSDVSGYPRGALRFRYPKADRERVMAWMTGDFGNVSEPASDTLLKNVTAAVQGLLNQYIAAASGHNLFTSPFKVGWALRKKDGTREMTQPLTLMQAIRANVYDDETIDIFDLGALKRMLVG